MSAHEIKALTPASGHAKSPAPWRADLEHVAGLHFGLTDVAQLFHAAIGAIAHPAVDIERMCNEPHGVTKADILHTTGDVEVQRDNAAAIENLIINDLLAAV